MTGQEAMGTN